MIGTFPLKSSRKIRRDTAVVHYVRIILLILWESWGEVNVKIFLFVFWGVFSRKLIESIDHYRYIYNRP